ncbi:hypothetical protein DPMN_004935 [Dreissena polymorpha]|uniref:Uncharacterized protein n=1 Tax=Dreissena polymorpha TaxID=45954 RepID=A0A9D4RWC1_DREPO|nr:hypothetical protein DPMN_004935 [Dreissena polymorpha]
MVSTGSGPAALLDAIAVKTSHVITTGHVMAPAHLECSDQAVNTLISHTSIPEWQNIRPTQTMFINMLLRLSTITLTRAVQQAMKPGINGGEGRFRTMSHSHTSSFTCKRIMQHSCHTIE